MTINIGADVHSKTISAYAMPTFDTESDIISLFLSFFAHPENNLPSSSISQAEKLHNRILLRTDGIAVIPVLFIRLKPASFSLMISTDSDS